MTYNHVLIGHMETPYVVTTATDDFAAFAKDPKESVPLPLTGKMDLSFTLPAAPFIVALPGLNGLPDIKFVGLDANAVDNVSNKQTIAFKVNVKVATKLGVKLGDIVFNTAGPAGPIGTTTFKAFSVEHGDNTIDAVTVVDLGLPNAANFVHELDIADSVLTLTGFDGSTQNPAILSGIEALRLTIIVPKKFTARVWMLVSRTLVLSGTVDSMIKLGFILGQKVFPGVGFEPSNVISGQNGLPDFKFFSLIENTPDAATKKQTISFKINVKSSSNISAKMSDIIFNAANFAGVIRITTFKALILNQGNDIIGSTQNSIFFLPSKHCISL
ncbi:hypothetical protein BG000_002652, partial [Podila horticola]